MVEGFEVAPYVEDWGDSLQSVHFSHDAILPSATWWGNPSVIALLRAAANVSVGSQLNCTSFVLAMGIDYTNYNLYTKINIMQRCTALTKERLMTHNS